MTVYMFQDNGDADYPSDMMEQGFEHLALLAERVSEDGNPIVTASEYRRWTAANAQNDRNGAYYPDGIAELIPFRDYAVLVMVNPDLGDEVMSWHTIGERDARGEWLYELTNAGLWTIASQR